MIGASAAYLIAAAAVPVLCAVGVWRFLVRRRTVALAFGDAARLRRLLGDDLSAIPWLRTILALSGALLLGLALADPRWGGGADDSRALGGPVVVVVDVSSSMLARDLAPDRLSIAKAAIRELVTASPGRAIGIVAFAGQAATLTPPTSDPGALDLFIDALDPEMVTQSGSAILPALRQALSVLLSAETAEEGGVVVLMTDGNSLDAPEDVAATARLAARAGIPILTVGLGSTGGAPVPDIDFASGREIGYKTDPGGSTIISRLDEALLRTIADESGGEYLAPGDRLGRDLVARVSRVATGAAGSRNPDSSPARYSWFAALALAALALEGLVRQRRTMAGAIATVAVVVGAGCTRVVEVGPASQVEAIERYGAELAAEPESDTARYNLGTALLKGARFGEARLHLQSAAAGADSTVRQRAAYNSGNSDLEPAFLGQGGEARVDMLRRSIDSYRQALLLDPDDMDAKWNLELARRLLREPPPAPRPEPNPDAGGGGGGGGAGGGGGSDPESANQDPQPQPAGGAGNSPSMSREAAERLLASAQDRELGVQQDNFDKPQPRNPAAH